MKRNNWLAACVGLVALAAGVSACGRSDREVGAFSNDLLGNEITIEAVRDPKIPGIVCHLAYFDRSFLDRMRQGNWFENPSNSAVSCQRAGAIALSEVDLGRSGEEIFSQQQSLLFKRLAVRRIVDLENNSLIYVVHSRELIEGSAKVSLSSISLTESEAATARRR